jgi:hypothetical protein
MARLLVLTRPDAQQAGFDRLSNIVIDTDALLMRQISTFAPRNRVKEQKAPYERNDSRIPIYKWTDATIEPKN